MVQNTKTILLETAGRLMAVKGYHNTSLDDVLRESNVGKGNFYHYFRSKEELGYAILDKVVQKFIAETLEPCFQDGRLTPVEQIHGFLDRVLDSQRRLNCVGGCPMGNLACELSDVHEGFRRRLAQVFTLWREKLTEAIRRGQGNGTLRGHVEPEGLAQFLVAGLEGAILMTKVSKEIGVMEQCVRELKRHLTLYTARQGAPGPVS
jgi:TetR/AcrR family transcriptional repressor of nem operon